MKMCAGSIWGTASPFRPCSGAMALAQRLDLRQTQSLVMTPQLQQAIKLLQLSNFELSAFVEQELEQNPLLERDDGERDFIAASGGQANGDVGAGSDGGGEDGAAPPVEFDPRTRDTAELTGSETISADNPLDTDYENVYADDRFESAGDGDYLGSWDSAGGGHGSFDEEGPGMETPAGGVSLRDHLEAQLNIECSDRIDRAIGLALIDTLDESGYLTVGLTALAEQLGCSIEQVESVLARVQRFDPTGVFARSLKECLALQLREKNRLDPAMQALLDNLELLAARNLPGLMKVCGVDQEDIAEMVGEIRALNPKPALAFDHTPAQMVTPDILMRAGPGGSWLIDLNPDTLPKVLVNQRYAGKVNGGVRSKEDKEYINERLQSANWLVKSLHQRATTILKVSTEIVRQQDAFFHKGVTFLRPLILRDIAEVIGMHESTVSRVTSNKFMSTPRGVYELKYFFTASIQGADGQAAHSAEAVRHRIKTMIDQESPQDVLSDDKIVEILRADGIDIARRTVAKYREGMRIPSSVQRRRAKTSGM
jgi:RNA polymerase sigma-54 factor